MATRCLELDTTMELFVTIGSCTKQFDLGSVSVPFVFLCVFSVHETRSAFKGMLFL